MSQKSPYNGLRFVNIRPYGRILEERFNLAVKYKLLKDFQGLWLTTKKCQDNYEDFGDYLKGKMEKPNKKLGPKYSYASKSQKPKQKETKTKTETLDELMLL